MAEFKLGIASYRNRAGGAAAQPVASGNIDQAIRQFKVALQKAQKPQLRKEIGVYLLKSIHFKAQYTTIGSKAKEALYSEGQKVGEQLEREFPQSADICYWLAVQWGK